MDKKTYPNVVVNYSWAYHGLKQNVDAIAIINNELIMNRYDVEDCNYHFTTSMNNYMKHWT